MEAQPDEETPIGVEVETKKIRKPLSQESLDKLKLAREKANAKRKEMAEQRKVEKEEMVQQKMEEVKQTKTEKLEKQAFKEAKKRISAPKKKDTVVVEYSSSDSDDFDFNDARILFVKKDRPKAPEPPEAPKPAPDPLFESYRQMFGPRF